MKFQLRFSLFILFLAIMLVAPQAMARDLRAGLSSEPTSIDPHYHNLTPNNSLANEIFNALTLQDENQKLLPGLAVSWKTIDDTTWEFKLRKGVKFHDGTPFTADDVIFTMERAPNVPNSPSSFAVFVKGKKFKKVDDFTIHVTTSKPYPFTPVDLSRVVIVSKKHSMGATTEDFNTGKAAFGTGAYKFVRWSPGDVIELAANDGYWGGRPDWDRVLIKPIKSGPARTAALLANDVDFIEGIPPTDLPRLKKSNDIKVYASVSNRLIYINTDQWRENSPYIKGNDGSVIKNPFMKREARLAVSKAINRKAIADRIMEGLSEPAGQFSPPNYVGYTPNLKAEAYDPEGAKKLLAQAGYPDGFRLKIHGPNDRYLNDAKILEAIAQMLTRVGIKTEVETMTRSVFFKRVSRGGPNKTPEFSLYLMGYANGSGEPSHPLRIFIHTYDKSKRLGPGNRGRYSSSEVDKLIQQGLVTMDAGKNEAIFLKATEKAMNDLALIPIHHQYATWAARKGFQYRAGAVDSTRISRVFSK